MGRLEAMSEIGVAMGRRMDRQSEMAAAYAESGLTPDTATWSRRVDEIGRAFAQVCRAVSVASAIEDRIDKGLPALPELDRARRLREQALSEKRAEATTAMERSFDADPEITNARRLVGLKLNLDRLLDREALDLDGFLARPLPQLVARLRRDLGLSVDDDAGLWDEFSDPSPTRNPSPGRGRVTSGGPQGGPHAIANDLAIAARNAVAKAEAGPVAERREDGVTDAGRQIPQARHTEPPSATSTQAPPATTAWPPPRAVTPSSRAGLRCAPARGAPPSPCRGRNPAPP